MKKYSAYIIAGLMVIGLAFQALMGDITWSEFIASPQFLLLFSATGVVTLLEGIKNNPWFLNRKTKINTVIATLVALASVIFGDMSLAEFLPYILALLPVFGIQVARSTVAESNGH